MPLTLVYGQDNTANDRLIRYLHPELSCMSTLMSVPGHVVDQLIELAPTILGITLSKHGVSSSGSGVRTLASLLAARAVNPGLVYFSYPEASIHPGCLGNLLEWMIAHGPWICSTHSEHFALRICKLVRDRVMERDVVDFLCTDGLGGDSLTQMAVSLGAPKHIRLRLDDAGEFMDKWPKGFFDERAKELF